METKVIHYCWFGHGPLPRLAKKCIASWKKYLPDYEIKEWNESNFDVNMIPYTAEAYQAKKYAFVSDYARFWILYHYGGLYFDTDVEVIKPLDKILADGGYLGRESIKILGVNPGLGMYIPKGNAFLKEMLDEYSQLHFINSDGSLNLRTIVEYSDHVLIKHDVKVVNKVQEYEGILIYPREYFSPFNKSDLTENTHSIHHCAASWKGKDIQLKYRISRLLPLPLWNIYVKYFKRKRK